MILPHAIDSWTLHSSSTVFIHFVSFNSLITFIHFIPSVLMSFHSAVSVHLQMLATCSSSKILSQKKPEPRPLHLFFLHGLREICSPKNDDFQLWNLLFQELIFGVFCYIFRMGNPNQNRYLTGLHPGAQGVDPIGTLTTGGVFQQSRGVCGVSSFWPFGLMYCAMRILQIRPICKEP